MKGWLSVLIVLAVAGCTSSPWSRQWVTKERIEQTLRQKLPVGTSRAEILEFFKKERIHVPELGPLPKKLEHTLGVSFPISWMRVPRRVLLVVFHLDGEGRLSRMTSVEADAGFL